MKNKRIREWYRNQKIDPYELEAEILLRHLESIEPRNPAIDLTQIEESEEQEEEPNKGEHQA